MVSAGARDLPCERGYYHVFHPRIRDCCRCCGYYKSRIDLFTLDGSRTVRFEGSVHFPRQLAYAGNGDLVVLDDVYCGGDTVSVFAPDGADRCSWGTGWTSRCNLLSIACSGDRLYVLQSSHAYPRGTMRLMTFQ